MKVKHTGNRNISKKFFMTDRSMARASLKNYEMPPNQTQKCHAFFFPVYVIEKNITFSKLLINDTLLLKLPGHDYSMASHYLSL